MDYSFPCVTAEHRPHPLSRYADNPLITALRFPASTKQLRRALTYVPDFTEDMRRLDRPTRRLLLEELSRFRIGTDRLVELSEHVNGTMLEAYAGRRPFTAETNRRLTELYKHFDAGKEPTLPVNGAQYAGAMYGTAGCGKTFGMDAVAGLYEQTPVIHHPDLGIWQVPLLCLSMPFLGMSRKTLATAIIMALAELFPDGNYIKLYLGNTRLNSNQLLLSAFALLQVHFVGYVLVDEAQTPAQLDPKDDSPAKQKSRKREVDSAGADGALLATLLIAMSNQAHVPVLFMGTPELRAHLGNRLSMLRRSVGRQWGPLSIEGRNSKPSEFDQVLRLLWTYQYLQNPAPYTERVRQVFHFYSYGIPDLIVKLFIRVQRRALFDGLETIDEALIHSVAAEEMTDVTSAAMALGDVANPAARERLFGMSDIRAEFDDGKPVHKDFNGLTDHVWTRDKALREFLEELGEDSADELRQEQAPTGETLEQAHHEGTQDGSQSHPCNERAMPAAFKGSNDGTEAASTAPGFSVPTATAPKKSSSTKRSPRSAPRRRAVPPAPSSVELPPEASWKDIGT